VTHVLGNFGLVGCWGLLGPRVPLGHRGVLDLAADRDAFDASYSGAGVSLTYGDSWDPCFLAVRPYEAVPCLDLACLVGYLVLDSFQAFEIGYFVAS
jgi:hypothetical protein